VDVREVTTPASAVDPPGVRLVAAVAGARVLALEAGPAARAVDAGVAVATRYSKDGILLAIPLGRRVGRVAFELSDEAWLAQPSVAASLDGVAWEPVAARASLADATLSLYRDPTHARGELRFEAREALWLRLDARLPARGGAFEVGE
jgi:hypothetical protein